MIGSFNSYFTYLFSGLYARNTSLQSVHFTKRLNLARTRPASVSGINLSTSQDQHGSCDRRGMAAAELAPNTFTIQYGMVTDRNTGTVIYTHDRPSLSYVLPPADTKSSGPTRQPPASAYGTALLYIELDLIEVPKGSVRVTPR